MQEVTFAGQPIKIHAAAWSLVLYEDEFGGDLTKDFTEAADEMKNGKVPLLVILKALWAFARTASPSFPSFKAWMRSMGDDALDMAADASVIEAVSDEFGRAFFRSAWKSAKES